MTSTKQIQANKLNALKSTGPTSAHGKSRSRCNSMRHGLTAETVVGTLEDAQDYQDFEAAIIADYNAQSAVERELTLRLANLLWRLRRANLIETGLFDIQASQIQSFRRGRQGEHVSVVTDRSSDDDDLSRERRSGATSHETRMHLSRECLPSHEIAHCFLRLANLPSYVLDRLSRYEATLWRQAAQIMFTLDALKRRKPWEGRTLHFEKQIRFSRRPMNNQRISR